MTFVHSSVQGPTAPASLARAIDALASASVDVIALVRGGGGELEAFDKELPVRAITRSPHPVWTGIGHTGDRSVSDDVAQVSYITPTECGQALVNTVGAYVTNVDSCLHHLRRHTERALHNESSRLFSNGKHLALTVRGSVDRAEAALRRSGELARRCADRDLALAGAACTGYRKDVQRAATIIPQNALDDLSSLAKRMATGLGRWQQTMAADSKLRRVQVSALDPAQQLRRGYSLTRGDDGRLIRAASDLRPGERIVTRFASGTASSTVDQVENEKEA